MSPLLAKGKGFAIRDGIHQGAYHKGMGREGRDAQVITKARCHNRRGRRSLGLGAGTQGGDLVGELLRQGRVAGTDTEHTNAQHLQKWVGLGVRMWQKCFRNPSSSQRVRCFALNRWIRQTVGGTAPSCCPAVTRRSDPLPPREDAQAGKTWHKGDLAS